MRSDRDLYNVRCHLHVGSADVSKTCLEETASSCRGSGDSPSLRQNSSRFDFCPVISTHHTQEDHLSKQLSCLETGMLHYRARTCKASKGRKTSVNDKRLSPLARGCEERYCTRTSTRFHRRVKCRKARNESLLKMVLKNNHKSHVEVRERLWAGKLTT